MADISVIIPCYNAEKYIHRCLESVLRQTIGMQKFEIILVDDASTDDTWKLLQEYEREYPDSIIAVHCDHNARQGTARNIGMGYASGEWIMFIDVDDWIELNCIEKMYGAAIENNCDIVVTNPKRDACIEPELNVNLEPVTGKLYNIDTVDKRRVFLIYKSMRALPIGKLIRRSILEKNNIFFPENITYEDSVWGSLLHFYVNRVYIMDNSYYHYFCHENSTTMSRNSSHHTDYITSHLILWSELEARGLFSEYREEIEYDLLYDLYLGFIKVMLIRFEKPSYPMFQLLRALVNERIADYNQNRYIQSDICEELHKTIFQTLRMQMSKKEFGEFMERLKNIEM